MDGAAPPRPPALLCSEQGTNVAQIRIRASPISGQVEAQDTGASTRDSLENAA